LNAKLAEQDIAVQTAKDENQALLGKEPDLKAELAEAEAEVQQSENKLKEFMVFSILRIIDLSRMIKVNLRIVLNAAKTRSKITQIRLPKNAIAKITVQKDNVSKMN
jgi:hypothetical protein